jgi:Tol biopolymer transport system component
MALTPGARLGPYEIAERLGIGGMGEVYRAIDTRLDRIVALKVLPADVSDDPARRQRFEREARAIASLNHPHICTLYDIGVADGVCFLVMEHLEGETLAQRLRRGPLPVVDALRYAIEIAEALDHAHRDGIVHRDLKPANVMLTRSGATLLDFGLAKAFTRGATPAQVTDTEALTEEGSILGTVHYMAPEQLEAGEIDSRTDIFAFGAVLYEMVSGRRPFQGGSKASVIAAILEREPAPIVHTQPHDVGEAMPSQLDHVIARCLAKKADERWQTAGDLMRELRWIADGGGKPKAVVPAASRSRFLRRAVGSLIVAISLAAIAFAIPRWRPALDAARTLQFLVHPPEGAAFNPSPAFMAVSPDGRHLAFSAANRSAGMALWLRSLDSVEVRQLTVEEGAQPFWSPDSRFIGFYNGGEYKKVDITNGRVQRLIDARGQSGTWNRDDVIVMRLSDRPTLSRFSASGGPPAPATTLDPARGETAHNWPQFLPDGRHFLYVALSDLPEYDRTICVGSLESASERTVLFQADSHAVYASPGYLVFLRGRTLVAQAFDAKSLRLDGDAVPIAEGIDRGPGARGAFSISRDGVLAYRGIADTQLSLRDRRSPARRTVGPPAYYANPALSPDGRRAAVARLDRTIGSLDIWLLELARGVLSRFTFDPSSEDMPLWSLDGGRIVFRATGYAGVEGFFDKASTGTGSQQSVQERVSRFASPLGWSHKGGALVYGTSTDQTLGDLWEVPRSGNRAPVALLTSRFWEIQGQPSPDGRWLAYVSNESGSYEVYVRSLSGEGKWRISAGGGLEPKWRRDGAELFYLAADRSLNSVPVRSTASTFDAGTPVRLFETRMSTIPNANYTRNQYDVAPDGQRFLINEPSGDASATPIMVVVNWPAALKR